MMLQNRQLRLENIAGVLPCTAEAGAHVRCGYDNYTETGAVVPVTSVTFSPNGEIAAVGDFHGRVTLLHLRNEIVYQRVDVFTALQSPHFVEVNDQGRDREHMYRPTRRHCPVQHVALSDELSTPRSGLVTLLFAAVFNSVVAVPHSSSEAAMRLAGHQWQITGVNYIPASEDGGWLVTSSKDRTVIWDCPYFQRLRVLREACIVACPIRLWPKGGVFIFGCDGGTFGLWDFKLRVVDSVNVSAWADEIQEVAPHSFAFNLVAAQRSTTSNGAVVVAAGSTGAAGAALMVANYKRAEGENDNTVSRTTRAVAVAQRIQEAGVLTTEDENTRLALLLINGSIEIRPATDLSTITCVLLPWDLCLPTVVPRQRRAVVSATVHTANLEFYSFCFCNNYLLTLFSGGKVVLFDAKRTLLVATRGSRVRTRSPEIMTPEMRVITQAVNIPPTTDSDVSSVSSSPREATPLEQPPPLTLPEPQLNTTPVAAAAAAASASTRQVESINRAQWRIPCIRLPSNLFFLYTHPTSDDGWKAPRVASGLQRLIGSKRSGELRWITTGDAFISHPTSGVKAVELSLDLLRKTFLQEPPWSFPSTLREDMWTLLLQLPKDQSALNALAEPQQAKISGAPGFVRHKQRLMTLLTNWAPVVKDLLWVEELVEPLATNFGRRPLFCFEVTVAILVWWGFLGCRFYRCGSDGPPELSEESSSFTSAASSIPANDSDEQFAPTFQLAGWQWFDSLHGEAPAHLAVLSSFLLSRTDAELWEHAVRWWGMTAGLKLDENFSGGSSELESDANPRETEKLHLRIGHRLLWPLIRSFCSQVLPPYQVLVVWDHVLCQPGRPLLPVAAAVAVVKNLRGSLLQEQRWSEAMQLLFSRRPQPMQKLLETIYGLDAEMSSQILPQLATNGPSRQLCRGMRFAVAVSLCNLGWPIWKDSGVYPYLVHEGREQITIDTVFLQNQSQQLLQLLENKMSALATLAQTQQDLTGVSHLCSTMATVQAGIRLETELNAVLKEEPLKDPYHMAQMQRQSLQGQIATRQKLLSLCNEVIGTLRAREPPPVAAPHDVIRDVGEAQQVHGSMARHKRNRVLYEELQDAQREMLSPLQRKTPPWLHELDRPSSEISVSASISSPSSMHGGARIHQRFRRWSAEVPFDAIEEAASDQQAATTVTGEVELTRRMLKALRRGRRATEEQRKRSTSEPPPITRSGRN